MGQRPMTTYDTLKRYERFYLFTVIWMVLIVATIYLLILVGGATRLTDSGLSITEWNVIIGVLPPFSDIGWQITFEKYQHTMEFKQQNPDMSMGEFKLIYYWEWGHRLLARGVGVLVLLFVIFYAITKRLPLSYIYKYLFLGFLIGCQGALGWWMVQSGLYDRLDVSQYRLAAHLSLACIILGFATLWCNHYYRGIHHIGDISASGFTLASLFLILIFGQIIVSAFVAGLRAGYTYNEWPTMDGQLIPDGLFDLKPLWRNFFDSILTVQFQHRMIAYILFIFAFIYAGWEWLIAANPQSQKLNALILVIVLFSQIILGIIMLVNVVPFWLGLAHQSLGIAIFMLALLHVQRIYYGLYE